MAYMQTTPRGSGAGVVQAPPYGGIATFQTPTYQTPQFMQKTTSAPTTASTRLSYTTQLAASPPSGSLTDESTIKRSPRMGKMGNMPAHPAHYEAKEAIEKAHEMHKEVSLLEQALFDMQALIARLKELALHNKAKNIERYFMSSDNLLKQGYLHEWHIFAQQMRKIHEIDGIHYARQQDLAALQQAIADLKAKRLHTKAGAIERYFMANDRLMMQAYLHEWRHFTVEMKKLHEIDGIHFARQQDIAYLQQEIARLKERRLHDKRRKIERFFMGNDKMMKHVYLTEWKHFTHQMRRVREVDGIHNARDSYERRMARAEALLRMLGGAIADYGVEPPRHVDPDKAPEGEAAFLKHGMHHLLQETDSKYVASMQWIPLNDKLGADQQLEKQNSQQQQQQQQQTQRPGSLAMSSAEQWSAPLVAPSVFVSSAPTLQPVMTTPYMGSQVRSIRVG